MMTYKEMYFKLSGQVSDAIDLLVKAQQEGEDNHFLVDEEDESERAKDE